jgi:hypothetical protein
MALFGTSPLPKYTIYLEELLIKAKEINKKDPSDNPKDQQTATLMINYLETLASLLNQCNQATDGAVKGGLAKQMRDLLPGYFGVNEIPTIYGNKSRKIAEEIILNSFKSFACLNFTITEEGLSMTIGVALGLRSIKNQKKDMEIRITQLYERIQNFNKPAPSLNRS